MSADYYRHEALDRCDLICDMVDSKLGEHPYIVERPELLRLIHRAANSLSEAYQLIGRAHLGEPDQQAAPAAPPVAPTLPEGWRELVRGALQSHRCQNVVDEDGDGLPLLDVLSNGADGTVGPGHLELDCIMDEIADALAAPATPALGKCDAEAAVAIERERCALLVDELAWMMENGAGEVSPGKRLRQAARNIRDPLHKPIWLDQSEKKPAAFATAWRDEIYYRNDGRGANALKLTFNGNVLVAAEVLERTA